MCMCVAVIFVYFSFCFKLSMPLKKALENRDLNEHIVLC